MGWRDDLQPASFREVPFHVRGSEVAGGRRVVVHEFFRGGHSVEDLGEATERFRVEAFVVGDDYGAQRDALIDACNQGGPGDLVHPFQGTRRAVCVDIVVRETNTDLGMAAVGMTFVEAPPLFEPGVDHAAEAAAAADALSDTVEQGFAAELALGGVPSHVAEAAGDEAKRVTSALAQLPLEGLPDLIAEFSRRAAGLADQVLEQLARPYEWAHAMRLAIAGVRNAAGSRRLELEIYLGILDLDPPSGQAGGNLPAGAQAAAAAVLGLTQRLAVAEAVRSAAGVEWEHRSEAERARDALAAHIDRLAESAPIDSYQDLMKLLGALQAAVPPAGEQLPDLVQLTLSGPTPSLVAAYDQYGSADRELELVARNQDAIRHPGQIPAGTALEALSA